MPIDLEALKSAPRVLIETALRPVAGTRIQPTGFPDLGPAMYQDAHEVPTLLVESAQSMANRLEAACWNDATDDIVPELKGLPFVRTKLAGLGDGTDTTCSLLEFHRLNSPYIMSGVTEKEIVIRSKKRGSDTQTEQKFPTGTPFADVLKPQLGLVATVAKKSTSKKTDESAADDAGGDRERDDVAGVVNLRTLAAVCFKYDPNSLVHGVFLEKIAGRLRHPRALSAFIEASGVERADSGGVKFDRALPKPKVAGVDAKGGYGNVPFHRTEFTAKKIIAYFSLDLAQIRGYGLPDDATALLTVLSMWKVRWFLDSTMRLRSACELEIDSEAGGVQGKRPAGFALPSDKELTDQLGKLVVRCKPHFADPTVTELTWTTKAK
jgi:CRISPR-associated protein Csb1